MIPTARVSNQIQGESLGCLPFRMGDPHHRLEVVTPTDNGSHDPTTKGGKTVPPLVNRDESLKARWERALA